MRVDYYREGKCWLWVVYDGNGKLFARGTKTYSTKDEAKRAFQKLDSLF